MRALGQSLPPKTLASTSPPTKLSIIGCGERDCVADYRKRTMSALGDEAFPIYCDPGRKLYEKLSMVSNLKSAGQKPEYMTTGLVANVLSSAKNILMSGSTAFKGGT